jgi:hypothetical protein
MDGHPLSLSFITLPLGCPSGYASLKSYLEKTLLEKIPVKEKEYNI